VPESAVGVAGLDEPMSCSSNPGRVKNFIFFAEFRPVLGPTHHPIQWVPGFK
jgi:hypothetical protein